MKITGVAAYNPAKQFHPKANNWLGFVIEIGNVRIYYAGDTDIIDEMKTLKNIDVALLPVGGKYTMDADEAAEAVKFIKPKAGDTRIILATLSAAMMTRKDLPESVRLRCPAD